MHRYLQRRPAGGARVPVASADGPVLTGARAIAFTVESASFAGWRVGLTPPLPVQPFGYTRLRFAFHPGTLTGAALNLVIGTTQLRLVAPRGGPLVDLGLAQWQVIEVAVEQEATTSAAATVPLGAVAIDKVQLNAMARWRAPSTSTTCAWWPARCRPRRSSRPSSPTRRRPPSWRPAI